MESFGVVPRYCFPAGRRKVNTDEVGVGKRPQYWPQAASGEHIDVTVAVLRQRRAASRGGASAHHSGLLCNEVNRLKDDQ